jgi:EpsI family protein
VRGRAGGKGIPAIAGGVLAVCALWPALALYGAQANHNPAPVQLGEVAVSWPQAAPFANWKPDYMAPDVALYRSYRRDTTPVALTLLYYRNQQRNKALISSLNRLAAYRDSWHETESRQHVETVGGRPLAVRETVLRDGGRALLVWSWMRIGGHDTTSNAIGKFYQAGSKALLRGDDGAAVMLSAPFDESPDAARATLHSFLVENYKNIDNALNNARQH